MTIEEIRERVIPIAMAYGVPKIALFGSAARGEFNENSDIDLIIEKGELCGFAFGGFCNDLEKELDGKVDVVTYRQLETSFLSKYALKDEVVIYER